MIDGGIIGEGSVQGLKLFNSLLELLKTAKKNEKRLAISDILVKLPGEAFDLAGQFIHEIDKLRVEFANIDPNQEKTIDELQAETSWWDRKKCNILRDFRPKITAITNQIDIFIEDVIAIAHCKGADDLVALSYFQSTERKSKLEEDTDFRRLPVGTVLDNLRHHAQQLRDDLHEITSPEMVTKP